MAPRRGGAGIVGGQFDYPDGHRLFPGDIVGLVSRFRSPQDFAATSGANFGI
jgi:hypothetical protein